MLRQHSHQTSVPVHPASRTELSHLIPGYRLYARTEGKSDMTIDIVVNSVTYFHNHLQSEGLPTDVTTIGRDEFRSFILYLQHKRCFSSHPYTRVQDRGLSGHTINGYLRAVRSFWSWLVWEEIIDSNPLFKMKIPKAPRKVVPTFSDLQVERLMGVIDTSTPLGLRNQAIVLTLLDTALRVSELISVTLDNLWLEDGVIKVMGKGGKERHVPIGTSVQRILWRYVTLYRVEPAIPHYSNLFLTYDGRPMKRRRIEALIADYGRKAEITGVRCSPHTFRHAAAVRFLRNGGNVFALQRLLGHTSLEMSRHYCEIADVDVKAAHITASPVDNFVLKQGGNKSYVQPTPRTSMARSNPFREQEGRRVRALPTGANY